MQERSEVIHSSVSLKAKLADYSQLLKFRLTFTVVFSAVIGFLLASPSEVDFIALFALTAGGFLVVGSANGINQIIERNYDKLMLRTHNRPVATNRMSVLEAGVFCAVTGIAGTLILGIFLNKTSAAAWVICPGVLCFCIYAVKTYISYRGTGWCLPRRYSANAGMGSCYRAY